MRVSRRLRFWWQRRTRGFDAREVWDLHATIVNFILPRLRAFRKEGRGSVPGSVLHDAKGVSYEDYGKLSKAENRAAMNAAQERWSRVLGKMIHSLELVVKYGGFIPGGGDVQEEFEEGWELFHKYFFNLWY